MTDEQTRALTAPGVESPSDESDEEDDRRKAQPPEGK